MDQFDNDAFEFDRSTGAITFRGRVVGEFNVATKVLEFNAGWLRLAGVGIRVMGDSSDRRRVLLSRGIEDEKPTDEEADLGPGKSPLAQPSIPAQTEKAGAIE